MPFHVLPKALGEWKNSLSSHFFLLGRTSIRAQEVRNHEMLFLSRFIFTLPFRLRGPFCGSSIRNRFRRMLDPQAAILNKGKCLDYILHRRCHRGFFFFFFFYIKAILRLICISSSPWFFLPRYQSLLILNLKVMIAQRDVFGFCRIKAKPVIMNVKSLLTFYHRTSSKIKKRDCCSLYANEPC